MIEDIVPPKLNNPDRSHPSQGVMPGVRLQGHVPEQAKQRLATADQTDQNHNQQTSGEFMQKDTAQEQPSGQKSPGKIKRAWRKHKKLIVAAFLILVGIGGAASYIYFKPDTPPTQSQQITAAKPPPPPEKPKTVESPLTGSQIEPALAKRPVTGVMIENSPDARPQSGLRDAGVIYEAIAEGGVTRFLALYQESRPSYIGPVRSIRPYYLDWLAPYDASIAHVGGSLDALEQVRNGMKDLDQFANGGSYWRISERYAPHNVYTSFDKLDALNQAKGYTESKFTPLPRKKDNPFGVPIARKIDVNISGVYYNAHYEYDGISNSYFRSQAGEAHVDVTSQNDGSPYQLRPKVVVVMAANYNYGAANDGYRSTYATTGGGKLWVFQDGNMIEGRWEKTARNQSLKFVDNSGQPVKFNPGQMWISVVSTNESVSMSP